ncbi:hypothetical protein BV25DRAFT_1919324 [Artomyces pyxidatus]|uniref:Uncharacterized protein n=1 Tax=Artomyces pyxidatus TaxID=48021 RepID=A0ACB8SRN2_9AGAM|nr:hypothetical protein BV25DRAFT_1919324 [Artomyces pyxidatus]
MTPTPSLKRRREEIQANEPSNDPPNFKQSEDFWLEDGNIILRCGATGFRVNRGVLSLHSTVLKDMFTMGQPGAGDQMFEGCAVVTLHDEAEDMCLLLKMLHFRRFGRKLQEFRLETLHSLLRIARKYMVDELQEEIVDYLKLMFPSELAIYLSPTRIEAMCQDFNPMLGVEIAVEFDIQVLLPSALYMSACLPLRSQLDGFNNSDGTLVKPLPHVLRSILFFQENMQVWIDEEIEYGGWFEISTCDHAGCRGIDHHTVSKIYRWYHGLRNDVLALDSDLIRPGRSACHRCVSRLEEDDKDYRFELWGQLPRFHFLDDTTWDDVCRNAGIQRA